LSDYASGTSGKFIDFGPSRPTLSLHGPERIMRAKDVQSAGFTRDGETFSRPLSEMTDAERERRGEGGR
jgi:hypothetical protein